MSLKDRALGAWDVLDKLPTTNAKIFAGIVLEYLTAAVYLVGVVLKRDSAINLEAFGMWLTFVLVVNGFTTWQWSKKRDTYVSPSPDSQRAGVPDTP
jgi:hypothetical protein